MGYLGHVIAIASIAIPISVLIVVALIEAFVVWQSGLWAEHSKDGGIVDQAVRASFTSRTGSRDMSAEPSGRSAGGSQNIQDLIRTQSAQSNQGGVPVPVTLGLGASSDNLVNPGASLGRWQVDMDGTWKDFDEAQQRDFGTAMVNGLDKVVFSLFSQRYELVFSEMVQRNIRTGKTRPVRCYDPSSPPPPPPPPAQVAAVLSAAPKAAPVPAATVHSSMGSSVTATSGLSWQVQMDSGRWIDMDAPTNAKINDAHGKRAACAYFSLKGQNYELNFAAGTQRNTRTNQERPVRSKPGASSAPPEQRMPGGDSGAVNPEEATF